MNSFGSIRFGSCLELTALLLFIKVINAAMLVAALEIYALAFETA